MIAKAEDYEYVTGADVDEAHPHGDLDRIVIDGEVMPLRTGDTGKTDRNGNAIPRNKILRGEDVAWLMEFAAQRRSPNPILQVQRWVSDKTITQDCSREGKTAFRRKLCRDNFMSLTDSRLGLIPAFSEAFDGCVSTRALPAAKAASPKSTFKSDYSMYFASSHPEIFGTTGKFKTPSNMTPLYHDYMMGLYKTAWLMRTYPGVAGNIDTSPACTANFAPYANTGGIPKEYENTLCHVSGYEWSKRKVEDGGRPLNGGYWGIASRYGITGTDARGHWTYGSGTDCFFPASGLTVLRVKMRHASAVTCFFKIGVQTADGYAFFWKPVEMTADDEGGGFSVPSSVFASKESLDEILATAGVTVQDASETVTSWSASINIYDACLVCDWDSHTDFS